jgi:predicted histidine transporter YuiF (NhaC family)
MLAPVAAKLGIDLVWFGVLLCVNLQTSFMHPPFGFALFYLRGIADQLHKSGRIEKKIESSDIYWGAVPWIVMQLILVCVVIFIPQTVTVFLDKEIKYDLDKVKIEMPVEDRGSDTKERSNEELFKIPPAPAEDPMKAILDAVKKDEPKKP